MSEEVAPAPGMPADFSAYVTARGPALNRFAFLVTGDAAEAADLVQDALERAWPRWDGLVARGTTEAYLRRSIANGAVSRWRKQRRLVVTEEPVSAGTAAPEPDDADAAWLLCAELPPAQRAAVVLRFYEQLPYDEIGAVLDCAEATARSHVHRALKVLRQRLQERDDDDRA